MDQRHREGGRHPQCQSPVPDQRKKNEREWGKLASWVKGTNYSMSLPQRIQSVVKSWKSTANFHQADDDGKGTVGLRSNCARDCLRDGARCDCLSRRNNAY